MGAGLSRQRLEKLEATITAAPTERGFYCPQCSGITITEALEDETILDDTAADRCRRCGELTLAGALRDMLAADEQK